MFKKSLLICFISIIIIAILIAGGFYFWKSRLPKKDQRQAEKAPAVFEEKSEEKAPTSFGEEISKQIKSPIESMPKTNPYETKTNPFEGAKTNPFENIYENPFSE